jgi:acetyl-CoA carboxylase carboxyl transferase subunit beta
LDYGWRKDVEVEGQRHLAHQGRRVALGVMNGEFIMGSMGSVVGERLTLLIEAATDEKLPLVIVCMSGGARMQEGAQSLMQMAKTSQALARLDEAGGLYISVLVDPTTGGTTASFAMLADVILAEPGAQIGFAGPRVIANTIRAELPEGFQLSEFLEAHGFIDRIVPRKELRSELAQLIDYCAP